MAKGQALSQDIDIHKINKLQERISINASAINGIVQKLIKDYCQQLDNRIQVIQDVLLDYDNPPTNEDLDFWVMEISTMLYFLGQGQEYLGIKEDISKAIMKEVYNLAYENAKVGTIADKSSQAELESQNERITNIVYVRAYKSLKLKSELGMECLQSIKKVISRRMSEMQLANVDTGRMK
jgi:hypothetical protein